MSRKKPLKTTIGEISEICKRNAFLHPYLYTFRSRNILQQGSSFPSLQHEALPSFAAAVLSGLVQAFQHSEPVDAGAVGVAVAPHIINPFQYQATIGQLGQIFQEQFLNRVRQA